MLGWAVSLQQHQLVRYTITLDGETRPGSDCFTLEGRPAVGILDEGGEISGVYVEVLPGERCYRSLEPVPPAQLKQALVLLLQIM
jgi:hypothetical protein